MLHFVKPEGRLIPALSLGIGREKYAELRGPPKKGKQRGARRPGLCAPSPFPLPKMSPHAEGTSYASALSSMPLRPSIWNGFRRVGRSR